MLCGIAARGKSCQKGGGDGSNRPGLAKGCASGSDEIFQLRGLEHSGERKGDLYGDGGPRKEDVVDCPKSMDWEERAGEMDIGDDGMQVADLVREVEREGLEAADLGESVEGIEGDAGEEKVCV